MFPYTWNFARRYMPQDILEHFHSCPECHEDVACKMECSIEPELEQPEKQFGSYSICDSCLPLTIGFCKLKYYGVGNCSCGICPQYTIEKKDLDIFGYKR